MEDSPVEQAASKAQTQLNLQSCYFGKTAEISTKLTFLLMCQQKENQWMGLWAFPHVWDK